MFKSKLLFCIKIIAQTALIFGNFKVNFIPLTLRNRTSFMSGRNSLNYSLGGRGSNQSGRGENNGGRGNGNSRSQITPPSLKSSTNPKS